MTKNTHKKIYHIIITISLSLGAILSGFFIGNILSSKYFTSNKYQNINAEELRDDISKIQINNKTPENFSGAIAFQIAEEIMINSSSYEMYGYSNVKTSAGVSSVSITTDIKSGNSHYIAFSTYSSLIKTARKANFEIGGNIKLYEGTAKDETLENCTWSDKYTEYTWDEYYEYFGKYANRNSTYIVSTKTVLTDSGVIKENNLYKFSLVLDPNLSTLGYAKQIGNNVGLNPSLIIFNDISLTFWLDENFKLVKHEKHESYTVPYGGISVTLDVSNVGTYNIH